MRKLVEIALLAGTAALVACGGESSDTNAPDEGDPGDAVAADSADAGETADAADEGGETPPVCVGELTERPHEGTSADPTFLRGPFLQSVGQTSAVVVWRDADAGGPEGCVDFSQGGAALATTCATPDDAGQYEVTIEGLTPGEPVTYTARVGDRSAGPFDFRPAPAEPEPTRLLVFADAHRNVETLPIISQRALADGVDLAVSVGDAVSQPEEAQWNEFFEGIRALGHRVPLFPVIGNHEARDPTYFHAFVAPGAAPEAREPESWYSVRWGDVWMAMLEIDDIVLQAVFDAVGAGQEADEWTWLRSELESDAAQSARWRLFFIHQPAFSQGWGSCDHYQGEVAERMLLIPLARDYGVSAIFSGHMHGWEHGEMDGVQLITTGGAGGDLDQWCEPFPELPQPWTYAYVHHRTLVKADCDHIVIEARDLDDVLVDTVEIH